MSAKPTGIEPVDAAAVARGYEARDVNLRAILALLAGFVIVIGVIGGGLWWAYRHLTTRPRADDVSRSVVDRRTIASDAPPLQPQEGHDSLDAWDLAKMRQNEDSVFDQLGWKRDAGTHRFAVPEGVLAAVRQRAATRPTTAPQGGGH